MPIDLTDLPATPVVTDAQFEAVWHEAELLAAEAQGSDNPRWFCLESDGVELDDGVPIAEWLLRWSEPGHDLRDTLLRGLAKALARTLGQGSYTIRVDNLILKVESKRIVDQRGQV